MPTAAKTIAALCMAALAFLASELVKTLLPEIQNFGNFSLFNAAVGAVVGWFVVGHRAGRGTKDAIGNGLTGVAALIFWALFLHAAYEMIQLSLKRRFDGPVEAFAAIFEIGIEYGQILMNPMMIAVLLFGALVTGYLSEYAARHWR
ncbi:TrgA family protein [Marivita sp. GX14005]|uniref:TrgA family protein n=1 Tax=Marivita sp. GX14005 TaxID=2942276 RepID=UPI0020186F79|nr:TrgA family protein [Marivita sp. GX14005]MCL3882486.1 TrgA family protein [Marivita sp. GX14005]